MKGRATGLGVGGEMCGLVVVSLRYGVRNCGEVRVRAYACELGLLLIF